VDEKADTGNHRHHDDGEPVDIEGDTGGEVIDRYPGPQGHFAHLAVSQKLLGNQGHTKRR